MQGVKILGDQIHFRLQLLKPVSNLKSYINKHLIAIWRKLMRIKEKIEGDVAVLSLSGKMMGGPETAELQKHVKNLLSDKIDKIVVDLAKVKWMNSSGLGALMGSLTSARNTNGDLRLANTTEKVQSLLMITQLMTIFQTYDSVDRAVASYLKD